MTKCAICKMKINSLMIDIYTCKCKNTYCSNHINTCNHTCLYDYKSEHKNIIKNKLPLVTFDKVKFDIFD
jgi:hypothetical protein